jgi:Tfp pilus assembly protein PilO
MTPGFSGRIGYANDRPSLRRRWVDRLRVPLVAWSGRRRLAAISLIAVAAFLLGANAWIATDLSGLEASRASLAEAQRRFDDARRAADALPALRRSAGAAGATRPASTWSSSDDVRAVSQLAARSGMSLLTLEPGAVTGEGVDAARPIRLTALADFAQLVTFVRALPSLPVLVVPAEMTVKQQKQSTGTHPLSVSVALSVFDGIRPLDSLIDALDDVLQDGEEDLVFYDPFTPPSQAERRVADAGGVALRLVGLLYDFARGIALVETPDGDTALEAGQRVGGASVARVDGLGMTLATPDGGKRVVAFDEAAQ